MSVLCRLFSYSSEFLIYSIPFFQQIMLVMCSHLLRKAPMFQGYDDSFIRAVLSQLDYKHFQEGDVIAHQYVPGDRMFFIEHGQVLMESDSEEKELCDGDFFGGWSDMMYSHIFKIQSYIQNPSTCLLGRLLIFTFLITGTAVIFVRDNPQI